MKDNFYLHDVVDADLPHFFEHQTDPKANYMAAFTARDPTDRTAFHSHWERIRANTTGQIKTIVVGNQVVGYVLSYEEEGRLEVSYWIGKEYWGQGFATRALAIFLTEHIRTRPLYARAAKDNIGSLRVLEKCGFTILGEDSGFANARGTEIEEWILELQRTDD
jgi:RimJ/RimL family protein N-acetyltransferase